MKKRNRSFNNRRPLLPLFAILLILAGCSGNNEPKAGDGAGAPAKAAASASSSRLDEIRAKGKLVIATGDYYPFEFIDAETQELIGYDVDLGRKIAEKLGVEAEWKTMQFSAIIPTVQNGQADMAIAALYITEERKQIVEMSDVYLETSLSLVKRGDNDSINGIEDLNGKKVGVKIGSTSEKTAKELLEKGYDFELLSYKETADVLLELTLGRVDAVLNDYLNQLGYNKQHPDANLVIVGDSLMEAGLGIALRKGDTELLELVNEVIKAWRESGEGQQAFEKWLG
jgi:ABC-type amino acid transport substrate-binding protein